MFGIHNTVVVLSESYACVKHLSVTAKILRRFVDLFFVQWPTLLEVAPKAIYSGRLPESAAQDRATKAKNKGKTDDRLGYILVTVGSTKFDDLIQAVDSVQFAEAASKQGFSGIHVQKGRGDYVPRVLPAMKRADFDIKIFEFTNTWDAEVVGASLVIGHAGAGTILDSLEKGKAIIVVPNTKLMNNHQVDIAQELANRGYVTIASPSALTATLSELEIFDLKAFPQRESWVFKNQIESKLNITQ
jgi:UDP-N-acetylglucosamine transferase subunit ALG13